MDPQVIDQAVKQASSMDWPIFWTVIGVGLTTVAIMLEKMKRIGEEK